MAAYIEIARINRIRKDSETPVNALRHNLREIAAELQGREGDSIDPRRTHLNRVLAGPATAAEGAALMEKLFEGVTIRSKGQCRMFEVVVDPRQSIGDMDGFFEAARVWLVNWFNCPLISAVVHYDQEAPHMHCLFVPIRDGRLQADTVLGSPAVLTRLHKAFQAQIGVHYGFAANEHFNAFQRAAGADLVLNHLMTGMAADCLTPNQQHQLRKAIANASGFDNRMAAFGIEFEGGKPTRRTPIGVGKTLGATNPYRLVRASSDALNGDVQTNGSSRRFGNSAHAVLS